MRAKWNYDSDNVARADGTGTYARGYYAASPSTAAAGESPESGPHRTRKAAEKSAEQLKKNEETK